VVRARALTELWRPQEALEAAEAALAIDPEDRDALLEKCNALIGLDEDTDALDITDRLLRREPGLARAIALRGNAISGNDPVEALRLADRAQALDPHNLDALCTRCMALAIAGRSAEAKTAAEAVIARHPGNATGYVCQAAVLAMTGDHEEARTLLDSLCYPHSGVLQALQASLLLAAGDVDRAERVSRRAIELNPRRIGSYELLADILSLRDRPSETLTALEQGERVLPDPPRRQDASLFGKKALLLRSLGQPAEARSFAERGHRLNSTAGEPLLGLALSAIDDGEPEEGRRLLGLAFERDPAGAAMVVSDEAERYLESDAAAAALLLDDELVARGDSSDTVQFRRGHSLWKLDRPAEASEAFSLAERQARTLGTDELRAVILNLSALLLSVHLGRHDEARQVLMRAHELDPQNAEILVSLAGVSRRAGSPEEASRHLAQALETDADQGAVLSAANELVDAEKYGDALQLLDAASVRWADSARFNKLRGRCLDSLGRTEEAFAAIRRAEQLLPATDRAERAGLIEHQGALLRQIGRPRDALSAFQRVRDLEPTNPGPLLGMTLLALDNDDLETASRHVATLVELDLDCRRDKVIVVAEVLIDAGGYLPGLDLLDHLNTYGDSAFHANWLRAQALSRVDQPREALAALRQAERALPGEAAARLPAVVESQGNILFSLGKHAQARAALERALDLDPARTSPLVGLALLAIDEDDAETAKRDALRLIDADRDRNHEASLVSIAEQLEGSGHADEALAIADRMIASDLGASQALFLRCKCLVDLGRTNEAAGAALHLADALPDDASIQKGAATMLAGEGRAGSALRCAERAVALNEEDAVAHQVRADVLLELGRAADSLRAADRSIQLDENNPNAYFIRVKALAALDRHAEAEKAYEDGLEAKTRANRQ